MSTTRQFALNSILSPLCAGEHLVRTTQQIARRPQATCGALDSDSRRLRNAVRTTRTDIEILLLEISFREIGIQRHTID